MAGEDDEQRTGEGSRTLTTAHEGVPDLGGWSAHGPRYELGTEIARGGGGRVLAATDLRLAREVAIKLPLEHAGSIERLVREARLIAQLEHPAIVPVHDLARAPDGTPCYVMKLLDGETLRARISGRSFEERIAYLPAILSVVDAVAYAHHRGIVHRDLKPSNVIIGRFGETFLIDWGLARSVGRTPDELVPEPEATAATEGAITKTGAVVGTPAYMAPEQAAGHAVDARADVYGLGAVLYHLLAGVPPYHGDAASAVIAQVRRADPVPVATLEPRVPPELAAIVAKAMARRSEDRYATAQELGADLRRYQAGRLVAAHRYTLRARIRRWLSRYRGAVAGLALATASAVALAWAWPAPDDAKAVCARSGDKVTVLWSAARRSQLTSRLLATGGPGASVIAQTVGRRLDGYARRLVAARVDACEATRVRGEQSAELLDRRMMCLDHRADDLRAAIALSDAVAPGELEPLVRTAETLPSIAACTDAERLREKVPLPDELGARAQLLALRRLEATAEAERRAGRYRDALAVSEYIARNPATARYAPLEASVRHNIGAALVSLGRHQDAEHALRNALVQAELGRDDRIRGEIWLQLAYAQEHAHPDQALQAAEQAGALAERLGAPELAAYHLAIRARLRASAGDLVEALVLKRRALESWQVAGHDDLVLADLVGGLGGSLMQMQRLAEAEVQVRRAIALHEKLLGPDHPRVAAGLANLAGIMVNSNRSEEAVRTSERARSILTRAGLAHTKNAFIPSNVQGLALTNLGRYDEAHAHFEQLRTEIETHLGPNNPMVGTTLFNLANNAHRANRKDQALAGFRRVLAWREAVFGKDHIATADARSSVARVLVDLHSHAEALPLLRAALAVQLAQRGPESEDVAYTRLALANALLASGHPAEALGHAEGIQDYFRNDAHLDERGIVRLVLARALFATGRDRARVIELAESARGDFVASKIAQDQLPVVDALLASARR